MYAYKGFEPDLSCRGYRFVMGKNVTPEANCASNGFHCAEDPLDCLSYYFHMAGLPFHGGQAGNQHQR